MSPAIAIVVGVLADPFASPWSSAIAAAWLLVFTAYSLVSIRS